MKIFSRDEMVADASSYSLSPLKPRAFVNQLDRMMFAKIESFEPATREQLKLAHDADHVDGVLDGRLPNGFGNKSPAVASSLLYTVGSIIAATREAVCLEREQSGRPVTCSPTSGFHHAGYDYGGCFCTFNGLLVAALVARQENSVTVCSSWMATSTGAMGRRTSSNGMACAGSASFTGRAPMRRTISRHCAHAGAKSSVPIW
jgi:hypothetical protein